MTSTRVTDASIEKRPFGKTDMRVSVLGFGGLEISRSTVEEVSRILHTALDAGLNVIDTAECYEQSEELIGRAVGNRRSDYFLFTKCGHTSGLDLPNWDPRLLERSIERSLQRLRTDHLDLVQLHNCPRKLLQQGDVLDALRQARDAGKTRYIGYSGDRQDALYAVRCGAFDALQTSVNVADQESMDLTLPLARKQHMGIIAKHPLANVAWKTGQKPPANPYHYTYWKRLNMLNYDFIKGDLDEAVSIALRFTLSVPGVDVAIVGTSRPDRWQHNAALVATGPLPQVQFEEMRARWKALTWWRRWMPGGRLGWRGWV